MLTLTFCACMAQGTGSISGNVTSTAGGPMPSVTVTLTNVTSGVTITAVTDSGGVYHFANLPSGTYHMNVSSPQLNGTPLEDIVLDAAKPKTVNVTVQNTPGANAGAPVTASVQIEEATPSLDTTTPQITSPYNTQMVQYLAEPNYLSQTGLAFGAYNLSLLSAGVTTNSGVPGVRGPVVGGQQPISNNFYVDGIDNNNRLLPGPLAYVSPDATTEFVAFQNQQPPEYGHTLGGQFNTYIRSGTNQFHGALYDYLQNQNLDAVDQTVARQGYPGGIPRYDQNRLGGNLGFPIIHNKLFFFGDFEYIPLGFDAIPGTPVYAPTAAGYTTLSGLSGVSTTNLGVLQQYVGTSANGTTYTTVNGVQVPLGIASIAPRAYQNQYNGVGSLDWKISNSDDLQARYVQNTMEANTEGSQLPSFFAPLWDRALTSTISEYHNFSPVLVSEIRLGYTRYDQRVSNNGVTFPGENIFPNITIENDLNAQIGPGTLTSASYNNYTWALNTTWTLGHHVIKFGVDDRRYIGPMGVNNLGIGSYVYSSLQGFLLNQSPDVFGARNFGASTFSGNNFDLYQYVNDSWQVSSNFNINLGLKYAYVSIPKALTYSNDLTGIPGVLNFSEPNTQKTNFAPIVGIAYAPGFVKNTVFRAGYEMNYDTTYEMNQSSVYAPGLASTSFFGPGSTGFFGPAGGAFSTPTAAAISTSTPFQQRVPYSMNWNAGIQTQLKSFVLGIRYLGVKSIHLPVESILNATPRVSAAQNLPLYYSQPSQTTLDSLTTSLASLESIPNNPYASSGFTSPILSTQPQGFSWYNGLQVQATQRFTAGFHAQLAYTYSHLIDNLSGPTLGGIGLFGNANFLAPVGSSIYDHRQRGVATLLWDTAGIGKDAPNWFRDVIANVVISGTYNYESPSPILVQSGYDSSLTGLAGTGGVVINPNATSFGTGSGVTPLTNTAGQVVAYMANNPNAQYIAGAPGLSTSALRSTLNLNPINNFDAAVYKRFALRDRFSFEVHGEAYNLINHPQYTAADLVGIGSGSSSLANFANPGSPAFGNPSMAFASHARTLQVGLRLLW